VLRLVYGFGVAFGPPFIAVIADLGGRYDVAFGATAALLVVNHTLYLWILARRGVR
jgi:hypothetical protein